MTRHKNLLLVLLALGLVLLVVFHVEVLLSRVFVSILAGAVTGLFETMLMFPLENLKTQQQLDLFDKNESMTEVFWRTITRYGLPGLYRGIFPLLIGAVPTQALRWGTYEAMCGAGGCVTLRDVFISGFASGIVVAAATGVPMESMKTRMIHELHSPILATGQPQFPSASGSTSLFKGWFPTIAKKVFNQATRFPAHSFMFNQLCAGCHKHEHPLVGFVAGLFAGLSSVVLTQPVDVVKTRMQGIGAERYGHTLSCCVILLREEGIRVFFRGFIPRAVRVGAGAGVTFAIFPVFRSMIESLHTPTA